MSPTLVPVHTIWASYQRTNQIAKELQTVLGTDDVAVIIDAKHLCVSSRGIKDDTSSTTTAFYGGEFKDPNKIAELQNYIANNS